MGSVLSKFCRYVCCCCPCLNMYEQQRKEIQLNRLAMVYEARGEKSKAADYYRKAADFAKSNPDFDEQMVKWFLSEARRMKKATKKDMTEE